MTQIFKLFKISNNLQLPSRVLYERKKQRMGLEQISSQRFLMWQTASIRSYQRELTAQGNPEEQIPLEKNEIFDQFL